MSIKPERELLVGEWRYLPEQDKLVKPDETGKHYIPAELDNLCQKVANYFILNAGRLITKEELLQDVWGIKDVSDGRVTRVIRVLRVALGDDTREPKYIETIPKRGYRFIAPVEELPEPQPDGANETPLLVAPVEPETFSHNLLRYKWIILVVITILTVLSWQLWLTPKDDLLTESVQDVPLLRYKPVTAMDGLEFYHNVSADEQYLVFSYAANDKENVTVLLLQNLTTHQRIQLTDRSYSSFGAVFSPDGSHIAYHRMYPDLRCEIRLLTLNDNKTAVVDDELLTVCGQKTVSARLSWSPDGKFLIYPSLEDGQKQMVLMLLPLNGGTAEQLTIPPASSFGDYAARFSRKGDKVAFLRDASGAAQIWVMDLASRSTRMLVQVTDNYPGNIDWDLSDNGIVYPSGTSSLSIVSVDSGNDRLLAYTDNYANEVFVSASGRVFSSVGFFSRINIYRTINPLYSDIIESGAVLNSNRNELFVEASPVDGGPVAVISRRSGLPQIWLFHENGEQQQLSHFERNERFRSLVFSPDGKKLLAQINNEIWLFSATHEPQKLLGSEGAILANISWSKEGNKVFYAESWQGRWQLISFPIDQPESKEVLSTNMELYQESFDGDYSVWRNNTNKRFYMKSITGDVMELPILLSEQQILTKLIPRKNGIYYSYLVDGVKYQVQYLDFSNFSNKVIFDDMYLGRFSITSNEKYIYTLKYFIGDIDISEISIENL